jgi:hypothetical protein
VQVRHKMDVLPEGKRGDIQGCKAEDLFQGHSALRQKESVSVGRHPQQPLGICIWKFAKGLGMWLSGALHVQVPRFNS